ncbi:MAG: phospholipid carrier-dependent glycosyltransferase, partial [Chloroflexi bacterium]
TSEFALRFFSVWFGILFIALFYRFVRHHFDESFALLAATVSVPFPFLVIYSQEARMYSMVLCATVLAMDNFLRWVRGERHAARKHFLFLTFALGIHYYAILLLAAQDVFVIARRELWRPIGRPLLFLHAVVAALLSAWLLNASGTLVSANRLFSNPLFSGRS